MSVFEQLRALAVRVVDERRADVDDIILAERALTDLHSGGRAGRLIEAAALVESVLEELNTESQTCSGCGREHFDFWPAKQAHIELSAVALKLRRWSRSDGVRLDHAPKSNEEGDR